MPRQRRKITYTYSETITHTRDVECDIDYEDESELDDRVEELEQLLCDQASESRINNREYFHNADCNEYDGDYEANDDSNFESEIIEEEVEDDEPEVIKRNHLPKWMQLKKEVS